jgi:hypothetical protein
MKNFQLVCVLLLLAARNVAAQDKSSDIAKSGNRYLEVCSIEEKDRHKLTEDEMTDAFSCGFFMLGLREGMDYALLLNKFVKPSASSKGTIEDFGICMPDTVELLQLERMTLKYIREHPEQAHFPTAQLVVLAQKSAFPCRH